MNTSLIIKSIVQKAELRCEDVVLEVGSGKGNVTVKMLKEAGKVVACEMNGKLAGALQKRVQAMSLTSKLEIRIGDILQMDLPFFSVCVANLPSHIATPFLSKLLLHRPFFRRAVLMFQKEYALRLVAKPGSDLYCRLSVIAQLFAHVKHVMKVGRNNFKPPHRVNSGIVVLEPKNPPPCSNFQEWDGLLRVAFIKKNKTLAAIFKKGPVKKLLERKYQLHCPQNNVKNPINFNISDLACEILSKIGHLEKCACSMNIDEFTEVLHGLNAKGIYFS